MKQLLLMLAVLVVSITMYVGCKQGEGDRCQVDDDCESGLCNIAKGTCGTGNEANPIDSMLPIDAAILDAPPDAPPTPP